MTMTRLSSAFLVERSCLSSMWRSIQGLRRHRSVEQDRSSQPLITAAGRKEASSVTFLSLPGTPELKG